MTSPEVICVSSEGEDNEPSNSLNLEFTTRIKKVFNEIFVEKLWLKSGQFPYGAFKSMLNEFRRILSTQSTIKSRWFVWHKLEALLESISITEYDLEKDIKYVIMLSKIMAEYLDFRGEKTKCEMEKEEISSEELEKEHHNLETNLINVFKGNTELITFALMQVKSNKFHNAVLYPLFRSILSKNIPPIKDHISYVRQLLCFRRWNTIAIFRKDKQLIWKKVVEVFPQQIPVSREDTIIFLEILPTVLKQERRHTKFLWSNKLLDVDRAVKRFFDIYEEYMTKPRLKCETLRADSGIPNLTNQHQRSTNYGNNYTETCYDSEEDVNICSKDTFIAKNINQNSNSHSSFGNANLISKEVTSQEPKIIFSTDFNNCIGPKSVPFRFNTLKSPAKKNDSEILIIADSDDENYVGDNDNDDDDVVIVEENITKITINDINSERSAQSNESDSIEKVREFCKKRRKRLTANQLELSAGYDSDLSTVANSIRSKSSTQSSSQVIQVSSTTNTDSLSRNIPASATLCRSNSRESTQSPHISTSNVNDVEVCEMNLPIECDSVGNLKDIDEVVSPSSSTPMIVDGFDVLESVQTTHNTSEPSCVNVRESPSMSTVQEHLSINEIEKKSDHTTPVESENIVHKRFDLLSIENNESVSKCLTENLSDKVEQSTNIPEISSECVSENKMSGFLEVCAVGTESLLEADDSVESVEVSTTIDPIYENIIKTNPVINNDVYEDISEEENYTKSDTDNTTSNQEILEEQNCTKFDTENATTKQETIEMETKTPENSVQRTVAHQNQNTVSPTLGNKDSDKIGRTETTTTIESAVVNAQVIEAHVLEKEVQSLTLESETCVVVESGNISNSENMIGTEVDTVIDKDDVSLNINKCETGLELNTNIDSNLGQEVTGIKLSTTVIVEENSCQQVRDNELDQVNKTPNDKIEESCLNVFAKNSSETKNNPISSKDGISNKTVDPTIKSSESNTNEVMTQSEFESRTVEIRKTDNDVDKEIDDLLPTNTSNVNNEPTLNREIIHRSSESVNDFPTLIVNTSTHILCNKKVHETGKMTLDTVESKSLEYKNMVETISAPVDTTEFKSLESKNFVETSSAPVDCQESLVEMYGNYDKVNVSTNNIVSGTIESIQEKETNYFKAQIDKSEIPENETNENIFSDRCGTPLLDETFDLSIITNNDLDNVTSLTTSIFVENVVVSPIKDAVSNLVWQSKPEFNKKLHTGTLSHRGRRRKAKKINKNEKSKARGVSTLNGRGSSTENNVIVPKTPTSKLASDEYVSYLDILATAAEVVSDEPANRIARPTKFDKRLIKKKVQNKLKHKNPPTSVRRTRSSCNDKDKMEIEQNVLKAVEYSSKPKCTKKTCVKIPSQSSINNELKQVESVASESQVDFAVKSYKLLDANVDENFINVNNLGPDVDDSIAEEDDPLSTQNTFREQTEDSDSERLVIDESISLIKNDSNKIVTCKKNKKVRFDEVVILISQNNEKDRVELKGDKSSSIENISKYDSSKTKFKLDQINTTTENNMIIKQKELSDSSQSTNEKEINELIIDSSPKENDISNDNENATKKKSKHFRKTKMSPNVRKMLGNKISYVNQSSQILKSSQYDDISSAEEDGGVDIDHRKLQKKRPQSALKRVLFNSDIWEAEQKILEKYDKILPPTETNHDVNIFDILQNISEKPDDVILHKLNQIKLIFIERCISPLNIKQNNVLYGLKSKISLLWKTQAFTDDNLKDIEFGYRRLKQIYPNLKKENKQLSDLDRFLKLWENVKRKIQAMHEKKRSKIDESCGNSKESSSQSENFNLKKGELETVKLAQTNNRNLGIINILEIAPNLLNQQKPNNLNNELEKNSSNKEGVDECEVESNNVVLHNHEILGILQEDCDSSIKFVAKKYLERDIIVNEDTISSSTEISDTRKIDKTENHQSVGFDSGHDERVSSTNLEIEKEFSTVFSNSRVVLSSNEDSAIESTKSPPQSYNTNIDRDKKTDGLEVSKSEQTENFEKLNSLDTTNENPPIPNVESACETQLKLPDIKADTDNEFVGVDTKSIPIKKVGGSKCKKISIVINLQKVDYIKHDKKFHNDTVLSDKISTLVEFNENIENICEITKPCDVETEMLTENPLLDRDTQLVLDKLHPCSDPIEQKSRTEMTTDLHKLNTGCLTLAQPNHVLPDKDEFENLKPQITADEIFPHEASNIEEDNNHALLEDEIKYPIVTLEQKIESEITQNECETSDQSPNNTELILNLQSIDTLATLEQTNESETSQNDSKTLDQILDENKLLSLPEKIETSTQNEPLHNVDGIIRICQLNEEVPSPTDNLIGLESKTLTNCSNDVLGKSQTKQTIKNQSVIEEDSIKPLTSETEIESEVEVLQNVNKDCALVEEPKENLTSIENNTEMELFISESSVKESVSSSSDVVQKLNDSLCDLSQKPSVDILGVNTNEINDSHVVESDCNKYIVQLKENNALNKIEETSNSLTKDSSEEQSESIEMGTNFNENEVSKPIEITTNLIKISSNDTSPTVNPLKESPPYSVISVFDMLKAQTPENKICSENLTNKWNSNDGSRHFKENFAIIKNEEIPSNNDEQINQIKEIKNKNESLFSEILQPSILNDTSLPITIEFNAENKSNHLEKSSKHKHKNSHESSRRRDTENSDKKSSSRSNEKRTHSHKSRSSSTSESKSKNKERETKETSISSLDSSKSLSKNYKERDEKYGSDKYKHKPKCNSRSSTSELKLENKDKGSQLLEKNIDSKKLATEILNDKTKSEKNRAKVTESSEKKESHSKSSREKIRDSKYKLITKSNENEIEPKLLGSKSCSSKINREKSGHDKSKLQNIGCKEKDSHSLENKTSGKLSRDISSDLKKTSETKSQNNEINTQISNQTLTVGKVITDKYSEIKNQRNKSDDRKNHSKTQDKKIDNMQTNTLKSIDRNSKSKNCEKEKVVHSAEKKGKSTKENCSDKNKSKNMPAKQNEVDKLPAADRKDKEKLKTEKSKEINNVPKESNSTDKITVEGQKEFNISNKSKDKSNTDSQFKPRDEKSKNTCVIEKNERNASKSKEKSRYKSVTSSESKAKCDSEKKRSNQIIVNSQNEIPNEKTNDTSKILAKGEKSENVPKCLDKQKERHPSEKSKEKTRDKMAETKIDSKKMEINTEKYEKKSTKEKSSEKVESKPKSSSSGSKSKDTKDIKKSDSKKSSHSSKDKPIGIELKYLGDKIKPNTSIDNNIDSSNIEKLDEKAKVKRESFSKDKDSKIYSSSLSTTKSSHKKSKEKSRLLVKIDSTTESSSKSSDQANAKEIILEKSSNSYELILNKRESDKNYEKTKKLGGSRESLPQPLNEENLKSQCLELNQNIDVSDAEISSNSRSSSSASRNKISHKKSKDKSRILVKIDSTIESSSQLSHQANSKEKILEKCSNSDELILNKGEKLKTVRESLPQSLSEKNLKAKCNELNQNINVSDTEISSNLKSSTSSSKNKLEHKKSTEKSRILVKIDSTTESLSQSSDQVKIEGNISNSDKLILGTCESDKNYRNIKKIEGARDNLPPQSLNEENLKTKCIELNQNKDISDTEISSKSRSSSSSSRNKLGHKKSKGKSQNETDQNILNITQINSTTETASLSTEQVKMKDDVSDIDVRPNSRSSSSSSRKKSSYQKSEKSRRRESNKNDLKVQKLESNEQSLAQLSERIKVVEKNDEISSDLPSECIKPTINVSEMVNKDKCKILVNENLIINEIDEQQNIEKVNNINSFELEEVNHKVDKSCLENETRDIMSKDIIADSEIQSEYTEKQYDIEQDIDLPNRDKKNIVDENFTPAQNEHAKSNSIGKHFCNSSAVKRPSEVLLVKGDQKKPRLDSSPDIETQSKNVDANIVHGDKLLAISSKDQLTVNSSCTIEQTNNDNPDESLKNNTETTLISPILGSSTLTCVEKNSSNKISSERELKDTKSSTEDSDLNNYDDKLISSKKVIAELEGIRMPSPSPIIKIVNIETLSKPQETADYHCKIYSSIEDDDRVLTLDDIKQPMIQIKKDSKQEEKLTIQTHTIDLLVNSPPTAIPSFIFNDASQNSQSGIDYPNDLIINTNDSITNTFANTIEIESIENKNLQTSSDLFDISFLNENHSNDEFNDFNKSPNSIFCNIDNVLDRSNTFINLNEMCEKIPNSNFDIDCNYNPESTTLEENNRNTDGAAHSHTQVDCMISGNIEKPWETNSITPWERPIIPLDNCDENYTLVKWSWILKNSEKENVVDVIQTIDNPNSLLEVNDKQKLSNEDGILGNAKVSESMDNVSRSLNIVTDKSLSENDIFGNRTIEEELNKNSEPLDNDIERPMKDDDIFGNTTIEEVINKEPSNSILINQTIEEFFSSPTQNKNSTVSDLSLNIFDTDSIPKVDSLNISNTSQTSEIKSSDSNQSLLPNHMTLNSTSPKSTKPSSNANLCKKIENDIYKQEISTLSSSSNTSAVIAPQTSRIPSKPIPLSKTIINSFPLKMKTNPIPVSKHSPPKRRPSDSTSSNEFSPSNPRKLQVESKPHSKNTFTKPVEVTTVSETLTKSFVKEVNPKLMAQSKSMPILDFDSDVLPATHSMSKTKCSEKLSTETINSRSEMNSFLNKNFSLKQKVDEKTIASSTSLKRSSDENSMDTETKKPRLDNNATFDRLRETTLDTITLPSKSITNLSLPISSNIILKSKDTKQNSNIFNTTIPKQKCFILKASDTIPCTNISNTKIDGEKSNKTINVHKPTEFSQTQSKPALKYRDQTLIKPSRLSHLVSQSSSSHSDNKPKPKMVLSSSLLSVHTTNKITSMSSKSSRLIYAPVFSKIEEVKKKPNNEPLTRDPKPQPWDPVLPSNDVLIEMLKNGNSFK